ncbi:hypothetical protein CAPTEDRAFT_169618 [Capitella teleta]|uniref:Polypeptide N-acetylgalactosaminyltransferase n=1 Tax=Capitella teleta TaxID=283909 RepID=R7UWR2_CAPTE|nr:hypothetical protein CAPTEDRAFT_169618 [Capitella teleta]|eukprot:ELU10682.1 hypothetical protein CAPTEDRAFT_169618 [Capitella teleta]
MVRSWRAWLRDVVVVLLFAWQIIALCVLIQHEPLLPRPASSSLSRTPVGDREVLTKIWKEFQLKKSISPPSNINESRSDELGLWRDLPDTRPHACRDVIHSHPLPRTGVVIPFFQEPFSVLVRTVQSVLDRTPDALLKEVVLVDDASENEILDEALEKYLSKLGGKVRLMRNFQREGLIRSRLKGMLATNSEAVVFLDANVEVNSHWLEPLLEELKKKPTTIVQPFVDGIDSNTMAYSAPQRPLFSGSFSWDLRYVWGQLPEHVEEAALKRGQPYWSVALVGCAMLVNRKYFESIGTFDSDQRIWGGENLELSFRAWMCGGSVVTVPCSRVGHIFRKTVYADVNTFQEVLQKNLIRTAEVWMDDFKKYFYGSAVMYKSKSSLTDDEKTSLAKRVELRKRLKCKSFSWFLRNVAPEVIIPSRRAVLHGEIANRASTACWDVADDRYITLNYLCWRHRVMTENVFTLTSDGLLMRGDSCVKVNLPNPSLLLGDCPERPSLEDGLWFFIGTRHVGQIQLRLLVKGAEKTFCIEHVTSITKLHYREQMPQIHSCDSKFTFQTWSFTYRFNHSMSSH